MDFLNPTAIALAAGATIPPLVALYFLKLKRTVHPVPSTLLWKRAVEDLHVNSPFQRLRSSLLLLLQLLILIAAALALGKPIWHGVETHEDTVILLIDQSASMGVVEADDRTRLEIAKEMAGRCIDNMSDDARAMVVAFCDQATVVSSFDTDKQALKRKIDSIEQTQSSSALSEAMSLAEAYTQNIIIGGDQAGLDIAPESSVSPATVFVFTDGRIEDADQVTLQKFDIERISVTCVGTREENVGILAMDARRNYERPEILEVTATVENFGGDAVSVDAVLYVDGENLDIQSLQLGPANTTEAEPEDSTERPASRSVAVAAFDDVEFAGGGIVEVRLRIDDALPADNRAWAVIDEPRRARVLLVTSGNLFLENVLGVLPLELITMTPQEYETAGEETIADDERSLFDVVMMDRYSTARLPQGNYFFWAGVPMIEGVAMGKVIEDQMIFNWDETHPVLRHVAAETIFLYQWRQLTLPRQAASIIDGETSSVLSYMSRDASQFLISAFSLIVEDDAGVPLMNTYWCTTVDFVMFMQNAINYLAANVATMSKKGLRPGQPVTLPVERKGASPVVHRPDKTKDRVPSTGSGVIHYARTRQVGPYRVEPGLPGARMFAVNLFNSVESRVKPADHLMLGTSSVQAKVGSIKTGKPAWKYLLLVILILLLLEWIVYNKRVYV